MMMTRNDVLKLCVRCDACDEAMYWLRSQSPGATAEQLLACCKRGDWMLWLAGELGVGEAHAYVRIACEIARSVLHLVPDGEDRPRRAIEIAERSLAEHVTREELIDAARDAAGEAQDAALAALSAAWAAWNAAGAARDAARAAAGAATWSAWAAGNAARAAARAARDAGDAARASQADIVMRHLPIEMWETACAYPTKGSGK